MTAKTRKTLTFTLGAVCFLAAIVAAFTHLPWPYFVLLFWGGILVMGLRLPLEKILAALIKVVGKEPPKGWE